jgi:asparagine synthase (glutamine-hydrolysing)
LNVGEGNLLEDLKNAVKGYSGPILTSNYLEHWKLLRLIKKDGYKVSVSGTGADELFSGYYDHYLYFLADLCLSGDFVNFEKEKKLWQKKILPFTRNEALKSVSGFLLNLNKRDYIFDNEILVNKYLKESSSKKIFDYMYCGGNLRNRMANELFHESVPPILYMDDSNSMYSSIENRSPFLDFDLYKWSLKIPSKFLIRSGLAKSILRDAVCEIADPKVCNNPRKVGFNVPIDDLIKNDKIKIIKDIKASQISEIINLVQFESLLNKNSKTNQESKFIFSILSLFAFLNEYST